MSERWGRRNKVTMLKIHVETCEPVAFNCGRTVELPRSKFKKYDAWSLFNEIRISGGKLLENQLF